MQTNVRPPPSGGAANAGYRVQPGPHMMNQNVAQQQAPGSQPLRPQEDDQMRAKPPMTPAQMLISHEKRLMEIESAFPDMVGGLARELSREIENIKGIPRENSGDTNSTAVASTAILEKRLSDIEATVAGLVKSYKLISDLTAEMNTSFFRVMTAQRQAEQMDDAAPTFTTRSVEANTTELECDDSAKEEAEEEEEAEAEEEAEEGGEEGGENCDNESNAEEED